MVGSKVVGHGRDRAERRIARDQNMIDRCAEIAQSHRPGARLESGALEPGRIEQLGEGPKPRRGVEVTRNKHCAIEPIQKTPQGTELIDLLLPEIGSQQVGGDHVD
ncbi:hypothetical protein D3C87_1732580 [compost metagenome]